MSEPGRRGRRDNGLDAALWSPLRDVDPRVGEHLLDVLSAAGIAAYLEPSADIGPYTRTVFLPSPPSDRLYVDRARRAEAWTLIDQQVDEHAGGPLPQRPRLRRDLDEAAEWTRIVAAFEAEHGRTVVDPSRPGGGNEAAPPPPPPPPPQPPPPPPAEPDVLDRPDEHFEPPPAPPVGLPSPASLYSVLLIAAGVLLVWAPGVVGLSSDVGLVLGVAGVAAGVARLVSRMRERSTDEGDDGAVV